MTEGEPRTTYIFKRSEIQPGLSDVEIQVPLSQIELDAVLEARRLVETGTVVMDEALRGSGWTREFYTKARPPMGYGLQGTREEVLDQIRHTQRFIRRGRNHFESESPVASLEIARANIILTETFGPPPKEPTDR